MRNIIIIILTIFGWINSFGQELAIVKDTVHHFEIGVPVGWRYGVPLDNSLEFVALRENQDEQDIPRENFNINIFNHKQVDLENTYEQFLISIGKTEGFKIIEQGEKIINNRKYKYLIETHKNKISKDDMSNYVLFTNNAGEILVLTIVTTSENFERFKDLFESIALSLNY